MWSSARTWIALVALAVLCVTLGVASKPAAATATQFAYTIVNRNSGMCLDVPGSSTSNGTLLEQWTCNGGSNQQWYLSGSNVVNVNSGLVLDVPGKSTSPGVQLEQWTSNGGTNQQFTLTTVTGGYVTFTASNSGQLVEVRAFSTSNGGVVEQWPSNGGANQQWSLVPVSGTSANLLVNPDAETGAAGSGSGNPPPGWTTTGDFTQISYTTGNGYPTHDTATVQTQGPPNGGNAFFGGGNAAVSTATQTITISSDLLSAIDASGIAYNLAGWLGGYGGQTDNAKVVATFQNSAGSSLGSAQVGPVSAVDRANNTGFTKRVATGIVPSGTRSVQVVVTATRAGTGSNDGYIDNLQFTLDSNLIVDGDSSAAMCSHSGWEETTLPGWTISSGSPSTLCYANTDGFPDASIPGAQPGDGYFSGGARGSSSMTQTVNVAADASAIDSGVATYNLSGWLGGYGSENSYATLNATFLNSSGASVGSTQIGPVTAADRNNATEFLQRVASGPIPVGARSIKLDLSFTYSPVYASNDGYAQGLSLTVSPSIAPPLLAPPASTVPAFDHVFIVYMENENYSATSNTVDGGAGIIGNSQAPYINSLLSSGALLSNYTAVVHNSDPNYFALAGGSTFGHAAGNGGLPSNCIDTCTLNVPSLGDRVDAVGKTWKQYADGASGNCDTSNHGYYYNDEVPFYYFPSLRNNLSYCQAHSQPLTQMFSDLSSASTTPNFVWFAADDCNDMEACGISAGDTWLSNTLPHILNSPAWTSQRSLLILTWDEDGNNYPAGVGAGQTNQVATIVLGSQSTVKTGLQSGVRYDHYSTARTIEQALGLGPLTANDQYAKPFNDIFN
jgi:hypothetical protein